jgi:TctA family transporter
MGDFRAPNALVGISLVAVIVAAITAIRHESPDRPEQPLMPKGFKNWPSNREISNSAKQLASRALIGLSIGKHITATDEDGTTIAAFKQYHFDNNPDVTREPWWHPGITLLIEG